MDDGLHSVWKRRFQHIDGTCGEPTADSDPQLYAPFATELDWRIAHWAVTEDIGQNSLNRLLAIPGVREKLNISFKNFKTLNDTLLAIPERAGKWSTHALRFRDHPDDVYLLRKRNPVEAVRGLWGDPSFADHLVYRPKKVFANAKRLNPLYSEMWTGTWWDTIQHRLPKGATVAPLIIATDKTQLTNFSGGKSAYPVYLTIGNLPKAIRRKPSMHACVLIGYLPTDKVLDDELTTDENRARGQRVFHEAMRVLLEPLVEAGEHGIDMVGGNGEVRRVFPILAAYVADFPEQCLVTCSKFGTCPKCQCPADCLGDPPDFELRTEEWTIGIMEDAKASSSTTTQYRKYCMSNDVSGGVYVPFWEFFPHGDIHTAITPDVLHQLYQGVFKHLVEWCQELLTPGELDRRLRTLPPAFGIRHFENGISALSQLTGKERKQLARVLLGCLVGALPSRGIEACRGALDFIYYAQYTTHDNDSLSQMQSALDMWEENKSFFVKMGVRDHINIPKFHSLHHYIESIRLFGTTDNYNTELFERLHIDFAKNGWRASNKRDAFPQMIRWLARQEKVVAFSRYISSVDGDTPLEDDDSDDPTTEEGTMHAALPAATAPLSPALPSNPAGIVVSIAKHPDKKGVKLSTIESSHCTTGFSLRLKEYLNTFLPRPTTARQVAYATLPFDRLDVYHQFKLRPSSVDDDDDRVQTVKVVPAASQHPARFDTVIVLDRANAEAASLQGTRVARVRVVFTLPRTLDLFGPHPAPSTWPKGPLAYVEWFSPSRHPRSAHNFFMVSSLPVNGRDHAVPGAIIPLANIRQSCMLTPLYGTRLDIASQAQWTSDNVLDHCNDFLVNNWQSMYTYKTVW
ncbi:hypothetical protein BD626DRAFT_514014 [Schizophyllum amplum]|uniref:Uncharacterized protein n=1 Tax=Schizophyllum amplum TaxID=97359 RepID=A0A550BYL4_9AGAR|nr:hypothetical protein BD626DRAFT_514014 [Auriculariopsis ampla]